MIITDKQGACIRYIESVLDVKFNGSTFDDAYIFIRNNFQKAKNAENEHKEYLKSSWR